MSVSSNGVGAAAKPFVADVNNGWCAVGATRATRATSNGCSDPTSAQPAKTESSTPANKGGGNFLTDLLGGALNFSGGGGIGGLLSSVVPGLGMLMTGLGTIFKGGK